MPSILVQNQLTEAVPGAGEVRLAMDFGNIQEVLAGDLVDTCDISISPVTVPALTFNPGSVEVQAGYLVSALFTGGTAGTYDVTFTPTLVSGQTLPPRVGALVLQ